MIDKFKNIIKTDIETDIVNFIISEIRVEYIEHSKGNKEVENYLSKKLFLDLGNSNAKVFFDSQLLTIDYDNFENEIIDLITKHIQNPNYQIEAKLRIYYSNVKKFDFRNLKEHFVNYHGSQIELELINVRDTLTQLENQKAAKSIKYQHIKGIGTDRLLGLFLLNSFYNSNYLTNSNPNYQITTFDFGTAITKNVIDDNSTVLGGLIMPGLFTQIKSLNLETAGIRIDLNKIYENLKHNKELLSTADNTTDAVINGILNNIFAFIKESIANHKSVFYLTGSYSEYFYNILIKSKLSQTPNVDYIHHSPNLNILSIIYLSLF